LVKLIVTFPAWAVSLFLVNMSMPEGLAARSSVDEAVAVVRSPVGR
jgi:hypothetical protein